MNKRAFRNLMDDLTRRVEQEGKKNPSWLMGYLQGKGSAKLTGYQCAALIDLLLVPLEKEQQKQQTLKEAPESETAVSAPASVTLDVKPDNVKFENYLRP